MNKIKEDNKAEFFGQIIDVFEDWLDSKGITQDDIPNKERIEYNNGDTDGLAIIFGSDYDEIRDALENIMKGWDVCSCANNMACAENETNKIGDWIITTKVHSNSCVTMEVGTKVQIVDIKERDFDFLRGYSIRDEEGHLVTEVCEI